jgi:ATP phosphoribosyltransferase
MSITIALPSKGRLKDEAVERMRQAGLEVEASFDDRSYTGTVKGEHGVDVAFLSAGEIVRELIAGNVHLGITGEDLARETAAEPEKTLEFCARLDFGHADVVVAIPDAWIDVDTMADLDDIAAEFRQRHGRRLRIATKYWHLTQRFFAGHGIAVYRIVESLGATEGAPAAGTADAIVDISSTGSTLRANNLKVPSDGVILRSQACLIRSKPATVEPDDSARIAEIVSRFAASGAKR